MVVIDSSYLFVTIDIKLRNVKLCKSSDNGVFISKVQ